MYFSLQNSTDQKAFMFVMYKLLLLSNYLHLLFYLKCEDFQKHSTVKMFIITIIIMKILWTNIVF